MGASGASESVDHENDLLRRFLTGDARASRRVERWAWEIVFFKGYGIPGDAREDIVQETVTAVWRAASRSGFSLRKDLRAFVRKVALARCVDWVRRSRPTAELPSHLSDQRPGPYDDLIAREERSQVRWALQNIDPACQELIQLHFLEELPYAEIAARWGRAEATLRVRMFNCMRAIRRLIGRWRGEP